MQGEGDPRVSGQYPQDDQQEVKDQEGHVALQQDRPGDQSVPGTILKLSTTKLKPNCQPSVLVAHRQDCRQETL